MGYVHAVISSIFLAIAYGFYRQLVISGKSATREAMGVTRQGQYAQELLKWHRVRVRSGSVAKFLREKGIRTLSLYGAGEVGRILGEELRWEFHLQYYLDKNPNLIGESINGAQVVMPYAIDGFGDAIVIAVLHDQDDVIRQELAVLGVKTPVLTLRDILGALHAQAALEIRDVEEQKKIETVLQ